MTHESMPRELQVLSVAVLLLFLGWVLYLVRYQRLPLRDSLLWLLSTFGLLVIAVFPEILAVLAAALRVEVPTNALFGLAILYLALNSVSATIVMANSAQRARRLAQECALLRAEIDSLRRKVEQTD